MPLIPIHIKEYHAILLQEGDENPPIVTELHNTIGEISWTRQQAGVYHANADGLFTLNKTAIILGTTNTFSQANHVDTNSISIQTNDHGGTPQDGYLPHTAIEIKIYQLPITEIL